MNSAQKPLEFVKGIPDDTPLMSTYNDHRKTAREFLIKNGFPSKKDESWRFINIQPVIDGKYEYEYHTHSKYHPHLKKNRIPEDTHLITITGEDKTDQFVLTEFNKSTGCILKRIIPSENDERVRELFSTIVPAQSNSFTALNTTLFHDGLVLIIPDNICPDKPIQFCFENDTADLAVQKNIRLLIVAGKNSQCKIILSNSGGGGHSFLNLVTEIKLEDNSHLDYYLIQFDGENEHQLTNTGILMEENTRFTAHHFSKGIKFIRNDMTVNISGPGAECDLRGLLLGKKDEQIDNHIVINHLSPDSTSSEVFKGILSDRAHGVFNGLVTVYPDAQLTSARQKNHTLLLSRQARTNSNPQLQINADNVKCSHGSTTGELDEEAEFYIRSRGISEEAAKFMLIQGFAREITGAIPDESVKKLMELTVHRYLTEVTNPE